MNGSETVCAGGERKDIFSWWGGCAGGPDSKVIYKQKRKGPSRCLQGHPAREENKQGRKRALVLGRASFRKSMRVQGYHEPVWRALEATVSAALAVTLGDRRNLWTWGLEAGPLWLLYGTLTAVNWGQRLVIHAAGMQLLHSGEGWKWLGSVWWDKGR